jgi:PTH1 family peptidyl-tRNA hydrolase
VKKLRIVLGIGNPGPEYDGTRHNIGWRVLDELARRAGARFARSQELRAETAEARFKNAAALLVKPLTFVNRTGELVPGLLRLSEDLEESMLVVCDDANLPLGRIRVRRSGSSGGHNGLQSLAEALGGSAFARLRIGIERVAGPRMKDHVLGRFDSQEEKPASDAAARAADAVVAWALEGIDRCMNLYNREREPEEPSGP